MDDRLSALDDETATRLLTRIAIPHLDESALPAELTPDLRAALAQTFGTSPTPSTEGDLARAVLELLAQQPDMQPVISVLLDGPEAERFTTRSGTGKIGKTISVTVAALMLLQTHLKVERDNDGRWKVLIEKQETSAEILTPIVQKILGVPAARKTP